MAPQRLAAVFRGFFGGRGKVLLPGGPADHVELVPCVFSGQLWRSIADLNPVRTSAGKPLAHYVADWQAASPDKTLPDQVIELFGLPQYGQVGGMDGTESARKKLAGAALTSGQSMNEPAGN